MRRSQLRSIVWRDVPGGSPATVGTRLSGGGAGPASWNYAEAAGRGRGELACGTVSPISPSRSEANLNQKPRPLGMTTQSRFSRLPVRRITLQLHHSSKMAPGYDEPSHEAGCAILNTADNVFMALVMVVGAFPSLARRSRHSIILSGRDGSDRKQRPFLRPPHIKDTGFLACPALGRGHFLLVSAQHIDQRRFAFACRIDVNPTVDLGDGFRPEALGIPESVERLDDDPTLAGNFHLNTALRRADRFPAQRASTPFWSCRHDLRANYPRKVVSTDLHRN